MALLDYKIVNISSNNRHIESVVRVYRGAITQQDELVGMPPVLTPITRYRRIATVAQRVFKYDIPRDMTREEFVTKARAYLNKKLLDYATENGHTVIAQQQDITDLEPVDNEVIV